MEQIHSILGVEILQRLKGATMQSCLNTIVDVDVELLSNASHQRKERGRRRGCMQGQRERLAAGNVMSISGMMLFETSALAMSGDVDTRA